MDIIRKYTECAPFWCKSHHHCRLCWWDVGDWILPRFTSFTILVNSKLDYSKSVWGVTNNMDIITKYIERASFWCKFWHNSIIWLKIWAPKLEHIFTFAVNFQSSLAPKPMKMSPPQTHITGISRLSTFIQRKSEFHSPLRCGATTAQSTILQVMLITLWV